MLKLNKKLKLITKVEYIIILLNIKIILCQSLMINIKLLLEQL